MKLSTMKPDLTASIRLSLESEGQGHGIAVSISSWHVNKGGAFFILNEVTMLQLCLAEKGHDRVAEALFCRAIPYPPAISDRFRRTTAQRKKKLTFPQQACRCQHILTSHDRWLGRAQKA